MKRKEKKIEKFPKLEQINKGTLKHVFGGTACTGVCDGTIVAGCCYYLAGPLK